MDSRRAPPYVLGCDEGAKAMIETGAVAKLVIELLIVVQAYTGYPAPRTLPEVVFLPAETLQERACGKPCLVYGFFPPGDTILLDDRLDPLSNVAARGILLHELVHYLQQESGAFAGQQTCRNWRDRERQAFDVQIRWLADQNAPLSALGRPTRMPMRLACEDEDSEPPGHRPAG